MATTVRPPVPQEWVRQLGAILCALPECVEEPAWVGTRWRVRQATVAHVFGGEDQRFRITFRAESSELLAYENLGEPYFRSEWGGNVVGLLLDEDTDWSEVADAVTDSYCLLAPRKLAAQVPRPA